MHERIFAIDLESFAVRELPAPVERDDFWGNDYRLFGDEDIFIAVTANPAEIFRIEADGSYISVAQFPSGSKPNSFAYRASTDTLYYQRDSGIYAAPHFDIANAERVALSSGSGGRGLVIGENSYVIVGDTAEVFNFDVKPESVVELMVGGNASMQVDENFRAENPNITLVQDPEYGDNAEYIQKLLAGEAQADFVEFPNNDDAPLRVAKYGAPIRDEVICAEIDRMPELLRASVTRDGEYVGFPYGVLFAYSDIFISPQLWSASGRSDADLPETWLELVELLAEISHSEEAAKYWIYTSGIYFERPPMQDLISYMTQGFARCWAAQGAAPDFGGADFRTALDAVRSIDFDALRFATDEERSQGNVMIFLSGGDYDPSFFSEGGRTLKIRREDKKVSRGSGHIGRINPESDAVDAAYCYMRWELTGDSYIFERLRYDFATPAEELAELSGEDASVIERYREQVGDIFMNIWGTEEYDKMAAAFTAYARGEIDFGTLAANLNEIYAA